MSFSILRRATSSAGARTPAAERPSSATASTEFWRAFFGQETRSKAAADPARNKSAPRHEPTGERIPRAEEAPIRVAEPVPSVEPAVIARELGLSRFASVRALQRLRRDFALKNHPDRVPSDSRGLATKRMMIANAMIDAAVKRFQFRGTGTASARSFDGGGRV